MQPFEKLHQMYRDARGQFSRIGCTRFIPFGQLIDSLYLPTWFTKSVAFSQIGYLPSDMDPTL